MEKNNIVRKSEKKYMEQGITLLALVITIIVLIILAGITISAITGDNGIIGNAGRAKEETEIANEKEIVEKATVQAMENNKYGNIEESELQNELDKETEEGETKATDIGDEFEVIFNDSNRYYIVDKDGNVGEANDIIKDDNPGDFTNGETLDGSEEHPYEISCIEDLVVLSNISRGKGNYIENGEIKEAERNTFSGKKFILTQTLNFNSTVSYADLSMTWRYDEEEEAYRIDENATQNLRDLLIDRNGVGFVPISENTGSGYLMFAGIFDGQNYEIQNLYENTGNAGGGLFNTVYAANLKNLSLVNVYYECQGGAGIAGVAYGSKLYNLHISGNINSSSSLGGIVGSVWGDAEIINCCNLANLQGDSVGGIINFDDINGNTSIVNCYNLWEIIGKSSASGIIRGAYSTGTRNITNTCSLGSISNSGGSTGKNFYSVWGGATVSLDSCYYLDTIINENVVANEDSMAFSKGDESVIDKLNTYVEEHKNDYIDKGITLYNWKLDANGLPVFEKTM